MDDHIDPMEAVCRRVGVPILPTPPDAIAGVADSVGCGLMPLNGLRHRPGTTSGWFIWAGEQWSDDDDFFKPVHVSHLVEWRPEAAPLLGLPEGWRFLIAPGYQDVWFDVQLLEHEV